ncbi:hypothetical protein MKY30_10510 [Oceanobacillus sp. FSL W8-0428]|uniref:Aldolase n=1 Tax=Oceanobacillus sojae TaxID=582851 RepID=A0A511ZK65_9BACI|nr:hypothetical protein [Oceanobacillus sojae]GEN87819.1 aldolase [Oceanobacillus sojae]
MSIELRMSKIFRPETGNTFILPVDHGLSLGYVEGLENPAQVLKNLKSDDVDTVLIADGLANQCDEVFFGRNAPSKMLCADIFYEEDGELFQKLVFTPETALKKGYDCLKLILFWDRPAKERIQFVDLIAQCIEEAHKLELPVLVEPLTRNPIADQEEYVQILSDGVRTAFELGADILKVPHPGDAGVLKNWVDYYNVPFILLGGGKSGTIEDLKTTVQEAIDVGVRGVAIGRNIWQRSPEEAKELMTSFSDIVHKRLSTY